jgi:3-dehydroquinate synthase
MMNVSMKRIAVRVRPNPYEVLLGSGLLERSGNLVLRALDKRPTTAVVVTAPRVRRMWGEPLEDSLARANIRTVVTEVPEGEQFKNLRTVEALMRSFARAGVDRSSCVIALGGGVIGDMAGFAAAVFMRGLPVIQVPTTLLAQVDAAVGGKTGVNLPEGKNLVGSFHQPRLVIIDPDALATLDERQFRAGLFEVIKCGIIRDPELFRLMRKERTKILGRDPGMLTRIISAAVGIKASVVAADEKESGLRRILNYGHTVGHALEAATAYLRLLHGEAVGVGMIGATEIAVLEGVCSEQTAEQIIELILAYADFPHVALKPARLLPLLATDKKAVGGVPRFVLAPRIGKTVIRDDVKPENIRAALRSVTEMLRSS